MHIPLWSWTPWRIRTLLLCAVLGASLAEGSPWAEAPSSTEGSTPLVFIEQEHGLLGVAHGLSARFEPGGIRLLTADAAWKVRFPGASRAKPEGEGVLRGKANFLVGRNVSAWGHARSIYRAVRYREIYEGIDLVFGGDGTSLKSEWIVKPGASVSAIRLEFPGTLGVSLAGNGDLLVDTGQGVLRESAPFVFQEADGRRTPVEGAFSVGRDGIVGFAVGEYDRRTELIVDPSLSYSSYNGGSRNDASTAIAVDDGGAAYVAGWTESANIPVAGVDTSFGGSVDAYIFKFDTGGQLVYATFVGGTGDDRAYGVAVDGQGNAYLAGSTSSADFPVAGPAQGQTGGGRDAFVTKLNSSGTAVIYSTYLGGSGSDAAYGIALDPHQQAYIAGETNSPNWPTRNPFQGVLRGGSDAFAFKLNAFGALVFSTYFGGSSDDGARAIAVSQNQLTAFLTGYTWSTNFPVASPAQPAPGGSQDAFAARFNSDGNQLVYSTFLGGSGGAAGSAETGLGIAVDSFNNAYVTGATSSVNFPVLAPYQAFFGGGGQDAFVTKFSSGGARMYSTFLGGAGVDIATAVRVDASRRAFVAGYTSSLNFPILAAAQPAIGGALDAFVVEMDTSGSALVFSSYLGGSASDAAYGIAIGSAGETYLAGITGSTNFPVQSAYRFASAGAADIFVAKLTPAATPPTAPAILSLTPSSGAGNAQTFAIQYRDANGANDIANVQILIQSSFTGLAACHIVYNRTLNLVYLLNNAATAWLGGFPPGAFNTVQNNQCSVNLQAITVSASGTTLTFNLPLAFSQAYAGSRFIYLLAIDQGGLRADWAPYGVWTIP